MWIGSELSLLERLTIKSFIDHGHTFRLWVYEPIQALENIDGLEVCDANLILNHSLIFTYKNHNQFGHGRGSVSGFSDIFRYKLLYDVGGWWVDMDVICLNPLDFTDEFVFRPHHELKVVGNIMKVPIGSNLMKLCFDEALEEVTEHNTDWHKPIDILNKHIKSLDLEKYIKDRFSNEDQWDQVNKFLKRNIDLPENYYCLHLMNEEWRRREIDKYDFMIDSTYGALLIKHGVVPDKFSWFNRTKNKLRHQLINNFLIVK